jgi:hypothetical protein
VIRVRILGEVGGLADWQEFNGETDNLYAAAIKAIKGYRKDMDEHRDVIPPANALVIVVEPVPNV